MMPSKARTVFDVKIACVAADPKAKYTLATNDFMAMEATATRAFANGKKLQITVSIQKF